jgi:hypothetical protein
MPMMLHLLIILVVLIFAWPVVSYLVRYALMLLVVLLTIAGRAWRGEL